MNVLVDTSVWSLAIRRKPTLLGAAEKVLVQELTELVQEGRVRMLGVVRQELLSGIKSDAQFEQLRTTLRAFRDEVIGESDYEAAAQASNDCRRHGIVTSLVDILICAAALRHNLRIFTTDPDFTNYARVLPLNLHKPRDFKNVTI